MISKPIKNMTVFDITQGFKQGHSALDIIAYKNSVLENGYGTPMCAPEDVKILGIVGDTYTPDDNTGLDHGYGVFMEGLETGYSYLFWHVLPYLPVWGGDLVKRGKIVAFMGNAGNVKVGGVRVPVEDRTKKGKPGTHLHWEMFDKGYKLGGKKKLINPLLHMDWSSEPTWTNSELVSAIGVVIKKMLKGVKKQ